MTIKDKIKNNIREIEEILRVETDKETIEKFKEELEQAKELLKKIEGRIEKEQPLKESTQLGNVTPVDKEGKNKVYNKGKKKISKFLEDIKASLLEVHLLDSERAVLLEAKDLLLLDQINTISNFFKTKYGLVVDVLMVHNNTNLKPAAKLKVTLPATLKNEKIENSDPIIKALDKELRSKHDFVYLVTPNAQGFDIAIATSEADVEAETRISNSDKAYNDGILHLEALRRVKREEVRKAIEEVTKQEVKAETSKANVLLDNKFIWVFVVLDQRGDTIEDTILSIDKAIDIFIQEEPDSALLVAYPYIDPNPEDNNVDLVFADNPGPIVLYDNEKATIEKDTLEKDLTDEEKRRINRGEADLGKHQLEAKRLKENKTGSKSILDYIKELKKRYDTILDSSFGKGASNRQHAELNNVLKEIIKAGRVSELREALVKLIEASDDKGVTEYLLKFSKEIVSRLKQLEAADKSTKGQAGTSIDDLAIKAGLI